MKNLIAPIIALIIALIIAPLAPLHAADAATGSKPNVLFIALDDLNDWIGCLGGHPQTKTPNIDKLAASGVLFANAHCSAPSCNPSRTAIFTGVPPYRSGLYNNRQRLRDVLPGAELLPCHFSRNGYWSAGSGKLLHYIIDPPSWDDYFPDKAKDDPFPRTFEPPNRPVSLPVGGPWQYRETDWGALDVTDEQYGGDWLVTKWIGEQLQREHPKPFFLACGIYKPHEPWFVPKEYFEPFPLESIQVGPGYKADDLDDVPPASQRLARNRYFPHIQQHGQWKNGVQAYLASIHFTDAMVGRVLDALDKSPARDNTIVVLWSDHGWHLGEKEHWQKYTGWRLCSRVPLIIRVPKGVPGLPTGTTAGTVCDRAVSLTDLFRTLTDLCGLPASQTKGASERSLVPLLRDPQAAWPHAAITQLDTPDSYSVSRDQWRYIHYANGDEELYQTAADPHEWTNLLQRNATTEHKALAAELRSLAPGNPASVAPVPLAALESLDWHPAGAGTTPPSKPDGNLFDVTFVNAREQGTELFWMDAGGGAKSYGVIAPARTQRQQTRPGAVWEIRSQDGVRLGYFIIGDRTAKAIIPDDDGTPAKNPVDRHSLVTRHNIEWNEVAGQIPLGNGEFCFNADGTGLQTFGGNSMAHWGWHSFPLPHGVTPEMVPATGTMMQGRVTGADSIGTSAPLWRWMFDNPHILNLGRIRLCRTNGTELVPTEITGLTRTLDLWSGAQTSVYQIDGEPVRVETCVHPSLDAVVVRIASPLITRGVLQVVVDFPYPTLRNDAWVGDFERVDGHQTTMTRRGDRRADFQRVADATTYSASLAWSTVATLTTAQDSPHRFLLAAKDAGPLEFVCAFSSGMLPGELPGAGNAFADTATHWKSFWSTGGAIDLSASKDPRWKELERRIVLSQYLMAAQSAGSWPSAETGLMGLDPWRSQFHMEMVWWHLAHDALWDRWDMADKALGCYRRFAPVARQLAAQLGYKGLKWPKSVGPEGRSAPWDGNQVLLWKQPHPIFLAELEYRLRPTRATLGKWADIIDGTAENMADYPTKDASTGIYSLKPVMPPSEQGITRDTVFDLAYWRWGLDKAQEWRERMGLPREPRWDDVRNHLAPLPVVDGVFVHSAEWHDTYTMRAFEHPDPVGVFGMLPPTVGVDPEIARRTLKKVWETWHWNRTWGWDCPWLAMAAARVGEPRIAVEALLKDSARNQFDRRGVNTGGPCPYLPGNGGLLYAVAMMAAGWDGAPDCNAPGFPADGSWVVKWEGLKKAP